MVYPGRLLHGGKSFDSRGALGKKSQLAAENRTEPVPQLCSKSMEVIDNMDDTAAPPSSVDDSIHGAAKYAQLGVDAWSAIMTAAVDHFCVLFFKFYFYNQTHFAKTPNCQGRC